MDYKSYFAKDFALDDSFQKWVLGSDAETNEFWVKWLKENPGKDEVISQARELVRLSGLTLDSVANESYLNIWTSLRKEANRELTRKRRNQYTRFAAVFTGVIVVAAYLLFNQKSPADEFKTAFAETREISLPDGTRVTLNANSMLRIEGDMANDKDRAVYLDGEAFFEVSKTKKKSSFVVNTKNGLNVQVLGTVFNVNARSGKSTEVFLQEGSVKLIRKGETVFLKPGEMAEYKEEKLTVKFVETEEEQKIMDWKAGNFVFNDTPLSDIIYDLKDEYGLDVVMTDSALSQKRITAKVSGRDVTVLLKVLSEVLNIKINQTGKQVVISPD